MGNGPMPMNRPSWDTGEIRHQRTLADYPDGEWINLKCFKCPRTGRVSRARMIAEHGADMGLVNLLTGHLRPKDCPKNKADSWGCNPCAAAYADLS